LRDLGSQVRLGGETLPPPQARCPTGLPDLDRLLGGGFPRARLSEIHGPASSGRTSLALALLATITGAEPGAEQLAAIVDASDAFDPRSAAAAGVELPRLLWARARTPREALRSTERLLQTEGIPLVLLDFVGCAQVPRESASWLRLSRLAASSESALVLLSEERLAGAHAELALELQAAGAHFSDTPALLERLESRVRLVRHRTDPGALSEARRVRLRLSAA